MTDVKYSIAELLAEGLLKRVPPSHEMAEQGAREAAAWITEARGNRVGGTFRSCLLSSYLAMFHAARAVLFSDGLRERAHFAVARYLEEAYGNSGRLERSWTELLDYYRELRHEGQYGTGGAANETQAVRSLESAEKFVARMKLLLGFG